MKNCKDIENLLPLYPEDVSSDDERRTVENHLASCDACRGELARLQKTHRLVTDLSDVEEPVWFQQKIMARVRREAQKKTIARKWFYPLRVKIPLQIAAMMVIAVMVVYIYRAGDEGIKEVLPGALPTKIESPASEPLPPLEVTREPELKKVPPVNLPEKVRVGVDAESSAGVMRPSAPTPVPEAKREAAAGPESDSQAARRYKSLSPAMEQTVAVPVADEIAAFVILRVPDVSRAVSGTEKILEESGASQITRRSLENKTTFHAFVEAKNLNDLLSRLSGLGDVDQKKIHEVSEERIWLIIEVTKHKF
jgi:hypothetical protein